ncbi:M15 family metallopeptidase [Actinotalea fermentans]|nr:M15 family metallopeptidase [Actinotalea fermentans]
MTQRLSFEAVAAATAVAFLGGAVAGVSLDTADRQEAAASALAQARQERSDRAATVRLTAAAARYATARQDEALAAAQAALADAQAVLTAAPALVGDATVSPLDDAVTQLVALVEIHAPDALPALPDAASVTAVADTEAASTEAANTDTTSTDADTTAAAPSTTPPAGPELEAPPADTVGAAAASRAEADALALVGVPDDVLDLAVSADLLAAAQRVAALSTQVAALSDDVAAELADAEEAAAARRAEQEAKRLQAEQAALQAALARMSTRIAATDAAPNGEIPVELLCRPRFTSVLLRCDAAQALDQLNAAYRAAFGRDLAVSGGYRTFAEQQQARSTKGDLAALPGTSNHGRGLAVDFSDFGSVGQFDDPDYLWMVANAPQYGWIHPAAMGPGGSGPLEPWHWEFGDL